MTYCVGLRFTNFARFRGTHEVAPLEPKAYAVVARDEENPERSNWLGKSSLVVALRYLLFGVLPKEEYETLDHAISKGEEDMVVDGEFSDGTYIIRERKRAKFATLKVVFKDAAGAETELNQDAAQQAIERWLSMDVAAYDVCSHIAQKKADQFSKMRPDALTEVVNGWVGIGRLEAAEEDVAAGLARYSKALAAMDSSLERDGWATPEMGVSLEAEIQAESEVVLAAQRRCDEDGKRIREHSAWQQRSADNRRWLELEAELERHLKSAPPVLPDVSPAVLRAAAEKVNRLTGEVSPLTQRVVALEVVVRGEFDGRCPIAKLDCPAKQQINSDRAAAGSILAEAITARDEVGWKLTEAKNEQSRLAEQDRWLNAFDRTTARIRALMGELTASVAFIEEKGEPPAMMASLSIVDTSKLSELKNRLTAWTTARAALEQHQVKRPEVVASIAAYRIAALVLGPEGAQKRLAEGVVGVVERGANARLARAGVDLQVEFRWGRETKKPATRCSKCGAAFPASARIKQCQACSAPRGLAVEPKLHLRFSNKSGAADDLAGVALTLESSVWNRKRCESDWGLIVLDEAFASLDVANCRSLAGHINQLVSDGFEQAFLIAHTRSVLESLPGRIEVVGRGDWSEIRVVA